MAGDGLGARRRRCASARRRSRRVSGERWHSGACFASVQPWYAGRGVCFVGAPLCDACIPACSAGAPLRDACIPACFAGAPLC